MRLVKFQIVSLDYYGVGCLPNIFRKWAQKNYQPLLHLGHELIDHTTNESGSLEHEFRAFGANLFVTDFGNYEDFHGYYQRNITKVTIKGQIMAEELESILGDANRFDEVSFARPVKLTKDAEAQFEIFFKCYTAELDNVAKDLEYDFYMKYKPQIISWFRLGYANARRRYSGDSWAAFATKKLIDELIVRNSTTFEDSDGKYFTLAIDVSNCYAELRDSRGYEL